MAAKHFLKSHALDFHIAYGPGPNFHFAYCIGVSMAWLVYGGVHGMDMVLARSIRHGHL